MGHETTPGGLRTVRCPHCAGPIFFVINGGPQTMPCPHCRRCVDLEIVHDGRKWTVRRLRKRL